MFKQFLAVLACLALGACLSPSAHDKINYDAMPGATSWDSAYKACKSHRSEDDAFKACMRKQGYRFAVQDQPKLL